jgi:hypothetical protein
MSQEFTRILDGEIRKNPETGLITLFPFQLWEQRELEGEAREDP